MKLLPIIFILPFLACAHVQDLGMFYTEQGLASAEIQWDHLYYKKLNECKEKFQPATLEAELCFGPTFEANKLVEVAVEESVVLLRDYWRLRSEGYEPDFKSVLSRIHDLINKLPDSARRYFMRVKGLR